MPLRVLHTEYASVARPVVAFIDELRQRRGRQVIVLIPVIAPDRATAAVIKLPATAITAGKVVPLPDLRYVHR